MTCGCSHGSAGIMKNCAANSEKEMWRSAWRTKFPARLIPNGYKREDNFRFYGPAESGSRRERGQRQHLTNPLIGFLTGRSGNDVIVHDFPVVPHLSLNRSEERRVGKGWRYRMHNGW